jgi:hypothetical protein
VAPSSGSAREVRRERVLSDELEAAFAYGPCEPHGPQNALGLDTLEAPIAGRAAHARGWIVAPPDYWHVNELGEYATWAARAVGPEGSVWRANQPASGRRTGFEPLTALRTAVNLSNIPSLEGKEGG